MNVKTNENVNVREYEFDKPPIQNRSVIDKSIRDRHDKNFHTFDHICEYNLIFTNIGNNELVNFTIPDKRMGMYELQEN